MVLLEINIFNAQEVSSELKHIITLWFHHWLCGSQDSEEGEWNNTAQENNKTYRKRKFSESNDYALNEGKWWAVIVVNMRA